MRELFGELGWIGVAGDAGNVHVERRVDLVEDECFALRVEVQDILIVVNTSSAGVRIFVVAVGEGEVVRGRFARERRPQAG